MSFPDSPEVKTTPQSLDKDKCIIKGDTYPLVIGQIVKLISNKDQPRICICADPGDGKTFTLAKIAELLHDELDILADDFNPEEQITQDPEKFINGTRTKRQKIMICPDADAVFPADEHYTPKNKANKKAIYLTRITGNLLGYDTHELGKTAKAIRTNHNIRLVSVGDGDSYKFKASYIQRQNDSLTTNIIQEGKGVWEVDKPKPETVDRIKELDEEEKIKQLEDAEEEIRKEKETEMHELI